jgi:hypothetical protein
MEEFYRRARVPVMAGFFLGCKRKMLSPASATLNDSIRITAKYSESGEMQDFTRAGIHAAARRGKIIAGTPNV